MVLLQPIRSSEIVPAPVSDNGNPASLTSLCCQCYDMQIRDEVEAIFKVCDWSAATFGSLSLIEINSSPDA